MSTRFSENVSKLSVDELADELQTDLDRVNTSMVLHPDAAYMIFRMGLVVLALHERVAELEQSVGHKSEGEK